MNLEKEKYYTFGSHIFDYNWMKISVIVIIQIIYTNKILFTLNSAWNMPA